VHPNKKTPRIVRMLKFNKITHEIIEMNNILKPFFGLIRIFEYRDREYKILVKHKQIGSIPYIFYNNNIC